MRNLKINFERIRDLISLREEYWEYTFSTNCYAFALGLDIPENDIVKNAYQLGVMGAIVKNISNDELKRLSFHERLALDLEALGIKMEECSIQDSSDFSIGKTHTDVWWIISLLSNGNNFHFIRKSYGGIWYQKWGYIAPVINYDFDKSIITNPNVANFGEYKIEKTYRLSYTHPNYDIFL